MTTGNEKHFKLRELFTVRIRDENFDGRKVKGWAVYQGNNLYGPYVASGWTDGPVKKAKKEADEALNIYLESIGAI